MTNRTPTPTNLSDMWRDARRYGRVNLYTNDDGTYYACIKFDSIAHTQLEARSDFKQVTPENALKMAIASAQAIVESVSKIVESTHERRLLP